MAENILNEFFENEQNLNDFQYKLIVPEIKI
jgi:hypothetical protein